MNHPPFKLSIYSQIIDESGRHIGRTEFCQTVDTFILNSRILLDAIIELNLKIEKNKIIGINIPNAIKPFVQIDEINLRKEFWYGGKFSGKNHQRVSRSFFCLVLSTCSNAYVYRLERSRAKDKVGDRLEQTVTPGQDMKNGNKKIVLFYRTTQLIQIQ